MKNVCPSSVICLEVLVMSALIKIVALRKIADPPSQRFFFVIIEKQQSQIELQCYTRTQTKAKAP